MNPDDFLVTTDTPIDQYICYVTGSVTATASGGFNFTRPAHNLSFIPLIYVQWSETPDFSTPRELLQNSGDVYSNAEPWIIQSSATSTYIEFFFQNWGGGTKTIYFRAWGFMPSDVSVVTASTSGITALSQYIVNSDLNYLKLHDTGIVDVTSGTVNISHNLGHLPVVMIWRDQFTGSSRLIEPLFSPMIYSPFEDGTPSVTTTSIVFPYQGFGSQRYHYRIYRDKIYG